MKVPFVDLRAQYLSIKKEIDVAILSVLEDTAFIKGKHLDKFESDFAEFAERKYCIGCANGTDAIEIVLRALGIGPGDEVIVPANTWISTAEAVSSVGALPIFVDPEQDSYNIDPTLIESRINANTKAIIPVHLYGRPAEIELIMQLSERHKLYVIEDCAQSHGARFKNKKVGTFGHAATFSFFPSKNLGAYGDAGAITTNEEDLAKQCRMIGDHGRLGKFDHAIEGRNSRLDGLQAAILSAKLPHLARWTELRRQHAAQYDTRLFAAGLQITPCPDYLFHVYHLYVIQLSNRERVIQELADVHIGTGIHYPIALPLLKAYERFKFHPEQFPVAYRNMDRILSLPMYPELNQAQLDHVIETIQRICSNSNGG